jgi:hypothetical protein
MRLLFHWQGNDKSRPLTRCFEQKSGRRAAQRKTLLRRSANPDRLAHLPQLVETHIPYQEDVPLNAPL